MNTLVSLLIPTYNGGSLWSDVLKGIAVQDLTFYRKIVVDSGSTDQTVDLALKEGFEVKQIPASTFNHGATRQMMVDLAAGSDICIFLTQDAIPTTEQSLSNLVKAFDDPKVALAYGRQLPHVNAGLLETHARLFNYPAQSYSRSFDDRLQFGFKVFFCSNSFSAYRVSALKNMGGFSSDSIMGEDAIASAKLLMNGHKLAYVAGATVNHSHTYSFLAEFRRYFDTRVFHEQNKWLIETYGKPTGEGLKYVKSELSYVAERDRFQLFSVFRSLSGKWLGYTFGKFYKLIPRFILKHVSMNKGYWTSS
ncbi:glycosyltransferase family 2 protein [Mucilaginibacter corticis]|uniref:Glycosyltransferase family 2 protein n=1 Tax=Mucilaginibacter corticis TaxID=2597670 RepID=A0A556M928_9SPHI|nr:glycosyltransferase family 2 protein [Mucilaginibacter corticis]TSJ36400.1 glycosyltransferase family 2 protein [Mucilaginibacter corticis]